MFVRNGSHDLPESSTCAIQEQMVSSTVAHDFPKYTQKHNHSKPSSARIRRNTLTQNECSMNSSILSLKFVFLSKRFGWRPWPPCFPGAPLGAADCRWPTQWPFGYRCPGTRPSHPTTSAHPRESYRGLGSLLGLSFCNRKQVMAFHQHNKSDIAQVTENKRAAWPRLPCCC